MEDTNKTNRDVLTKGIKQMLVCLFLMFSGPSLLHLALNNDDKPLFILLLSIAIIFCIGAIVFLFIGINTILNSMFKKK